MSSSSWGHRVLRAADFVQAHLDEELTSERLADVAGFSKHHFHRIFRGVTGESVMGFVRRLRLERAAGLLGHGTAPVVDVALASGYESHEGFTRAFHARFGVAPTDYRDGKRHPSAAMHVELRQEPERVVVARRHVGPYDECARVWQQLRAWAGPAGVIAQSSSSVGLCYDDPEITDPTRLRYDAGFVVPVSLPRRTSLPVDIVVRRIPSGRYAVATHRGGYDDLEGTYVALLGRALPQRGVELADEPVVEVYVDDADQTPATDVRTEVCVRVA